MSRHRRSSDTTRSLWLRDRHDPVTLPLDRWRDYPHFLETLREHGDELPRLVEVRWDHFADFTRHGFDDEDDWDFVDEVANRMRSGADIPPLVRQTGHRFDGVHRAFAARSLGMRTAPVFVLPRRTR